MAPLDSDLSGGNLHERQRQGKRRLHQQNYFPASHHTNWKPIARSATATIHGRCKILWQDSMHQNAPFQCQACAELVKPIMRVIFSWQTEPSLHHIHKYRNFPFLHDPLGSASCPLAGGPWSLKVWTLRLLNLPICLAYFDFNPVRR